MQSNISRRDALRLAGITAAASAVNGTASGAYAVAKTPESGNTIAGAFTSGRYTLPELPYPYDALEPLYEERTLRIHHTKHHAGYVNGLNGTLAKLAGARDAADYTDIKDLSLALAFHGSGHILHSLFWRSMTPGGCEIPESLGKALKADFGSTDAARAQFAAAAKKVEGSGWAVLAYEPVGRKLLVLQAEKHQNLTLWGVLPLLVCDVWEHAYYLQYANNRAAWVDNFLKLANWEFAARRMAETG